VPEARRVRPQERDTVLSMLVEAFDQDRLVRWWFPDDDYSDHARAYFGVLLDTRIEGGEVWATEDLHAASLWIPPGGNLLGSETVSQRYRAMLTGLPDVVRERIGIADQAVDRLLPQIPHWYLGVLATRPGHRGEGRATAVVRPLLRSADRSGVPVALETAEPNNVEFYRRRGFAVIGRTRLPGLAGEPGPQLTVMRRSQRLDGPETC
jgi:GNAT superfamily N-acetyltransferase